MQNKTTFKNFTGLLSKMILVMGLFVWSAGINAQTVSTSTGTNYLGNYSLNNPNPLIQTFVVENTNATPRILTDVTMQMAPYFGNSGPSTITLFYSATSLSGPPSVVAPDWIQIGTGNVTVPAALQDIPVITGLNFTIPANTQYRFAIQATKGLAFSVTPTPTPNIFTVGGISLKTGDFQIAGLGIGWAGVAPTPNPANTPTFFGGSVTLTTGLPCAGAPAPGNTVSTASTVCDGTFFTLSTQNASTGTGITYQWQSSPDGINWTDIPGALAASLTLTQSVATYYQLVVTCAGTPVNSTPLQVLLTPQSGCYCLAGSTDTDPQFEKIAQVQFGGLNNSSTSADGYENFTNLTPVNDFEAGSTTPMTVTSSNGFGSDIVKIWIDYNQNGSFGDPGENVYTSLQGVGPYTTNITIPTTATNGNTRMRIRLYDDFFGNGNNTPCGDNVYGQVEDYTINITPCRPIAITAQPTDVSVQCGSEAVFMFDADGTSITFQWQVKTSATAAWTDVVDGSTISGATTNTLHVGGLDASFSGYQYRAVIEGGCSAIDFSNTVTLTVTPLVIVVDPASYSTCDPIPAGTPVQLSITNVNGGNISTTTSYASGPLNTLIPDDDPAGIINTIVVPPLPAGAVIQSAKVTLNITHPYVGDLSINLKAPNNKIFNLDYLLGATGGDVTPTGFVNTVISSTGTNLLSAGVDPYTDTFAPDAVVVPPPGFPPTGATLIGDADVANFSDLYTIPDGNWTIGMYDAGAIDEGTLLNWTLTLTYTATSTDPVTGVWSPATGLFTDNAGAVPYVAGTEQNTVYAAPASTTVYTVTVTNSICPSAPVEVPVRILSHDPSLSLTVLPYNNIYPGLRTELKAVVDPSSPTNTFQWYHNGDTIPGATSSTYEVSFANTGIGEYSVDLIDSTICSGRLHAGPVTIGDTTTKNLYIWPNPSSGQFQVRYNDGLTDIRSKAPYLGVYDSKGSRVFLQSFVLTEAYGRMDVDLSGQPKGTYMVVLYSADGTLLTSGRVIIR